MAGKQTVPGAEVMAGQIIQRTETLAAVREELHGVHAEIGRLRRGAGGRGLEDRREREEELLDKTCFSPEPFAPNTIFREWKLEFEDYIAGLSPREVREVQGGDRGRWRD